MKVKHLFYSLNEIYILIFFFVIFDAAIWIKSCMNNLWGIEFNPINWIYQEELLFLDQVIDYEVIDYEILIQFIGFMIYFNMKIEISIFVFIYQLSDE
jgi:hypothetical protein